MPNLTATPPVIAARDVWRWRGQARPSFAETPGDDQESVWDYPRPPRIETITSELRVAHGGRDVAHTMRGKRVLETSHAPTYYVPPDAIDRARVTIMDRSTHCEWKGISTAVRVDDVDNAGWVICEAYPEFAELLGWYAFYPQTLACFFDGVRVTPQPGAYYGGWVTPNLAGPIKGSPGSGDW